MSPTVGRPGPPRQVERAGRDTEDKMDLEQRSSRRRRSSTPDGTQRSAHCRIGARIAERIARLGSETAFAVSAEAAAFAAQGNIMYPFHLGDLNLPTPPNIVEASFKAIADGKTGYCPNAGIPRAAGGPRRRRERLARHDLRSGERRDSARWQARHRQVHPRPHEPWRRGALPEPRLSDLRVPDRVPRRRRRALRLPRGRHRAS